MTGVYCLHPWSLACLSAWQRAWRHACLSEWTPKDARQRANKKENKAGVGRENTQETGSSGLRFQRMYRLIVQAFKPQCFKTRLEESRKENKKIQSINKTVKN